MSDRNMPGDLTPCPYCGGEAYSFFNGEYEEDIDECKCSEEERAFIDALNPTSQTIPDYEALEALVEKDILPYHPIGEKLDSWGCSSRERTLFSSNKRNNARIRKVVRRRVEEEQFFSA